ncbi:NAD-dependent histone deacetylase HST3 [Psilocybe cubensis]|uniref:Deacetylase sirtuin-type domain-containing protein n=2 Tax=Psilocybe cubensis TaxID=181762 RepID=A0A8H8CRB3_PSICU|nr:NAD-dependent histone deacetylase HST3 [Psilocybe cubensis]KAH9486536.1 NAD-dependent histone deacetylase HST3 [Psilocybe cubensis]
MTVTLDLESAQTDAQTRRSLSDISLAVAKGKKIVVVTGAGISCSCGIPDFRSSDGLYAMVKEQYPDVVLKGRDLFDASLFRDATSTAVFYTFISQLKRSIDKAEPTQTHQFIKILDSKKKLLRSYTQNIDGLEARLGLLGSSCHEAKSNGKSKTKIRTKDVRNVQLHGDIHRVRCVACSAEFPCEEKHLVVFEQGNAPECPECLLRSEARAARSARPIRVGTLRPGIVLYDESHPLGDDIGAIHTFDLGRKPDMLIIMGTSLKVHGLKKLVKDFARTIHSSTTSSTASSSKKPFKVIFVNKTAPGAEWSDIIDYHISGETDRWTSKVIEDWKKMRPADWEIQQTLIENECDTSMTNGLKLGKSLLSTKVKTKKAASGRENIPILPPDLTQNVPTRSENLKPVPPLSPSKRQQKSCHYNDVESSPSKRQTLSVNRNVIPQEERKMLFAEATNKSSVIAKDPRELSQMDISLCDLRPPSRSRKTSTKDRNVKSVETSAMDISKLDLSMHDASILLSPTKVPSKAKRPVKQHTVTSRPVRRSANVGAGKRVSRKRPEVV